jgi:adenylate cyclase
MAEERIERRLAAILAADVVGYSRLVGIDEEGTLAALKALRKSLIDPKITEHRGRIVKNTGDGALVEFASAVDAVRCAVETQREMADRTTNIPEDRRIELRIGINIGDIVIEEGDIFGDGVNVAVRLESIATPGGVCISEDVYRQVRGKLDAIFEDIGASEIEEHCAARACLSDADCRHLRWCLDRRTFFEPTFARQTIDCGTCFPKHER